MDRAADGDSAVAIDLAAELLRRGRSIDLVVGGMSMWPLVRGGERVHLDPAVPPRVGFLAGILQEGRLVVHRIVRVGGGRVTLLGDFGGREASVELPELLGVVTVQWTRDGRMIRHDRTMRRAANYLCALATRTTRWPWRFVHRLARLRASVRRRLSA